MSQAEDRQVQVTFTVYKHTFNSIKRREMVGNILSKAQLRTSYMIHTYEYQTKAWS